MPMMPRFPRLPSGGQTPPLILPAGKPSSGDASTWKDLAQKMSTDEVRMAKARLDELKNTLKPLGGPDQMNRPDLLTQTSQIKNEITKLEKRLDQDDQLVARGSEKDRLSHELSELEEQIIKEAPSYNTQWTTVKQHGEVAFDQSVRQMQDWQNKNIRKIERWKEIKRRLEPDNPFADRTDCLMQGFQKVPS